MDLDHATVTPVLNYSSIVHLNCLSIILGIFRDNARVKALVGEADPHEQANRISKQSLSFASVHVLPFR